MMKWTEGPSERTGVMPGLITTVMVAFRMVVRTNSSVYGDNDKSKRCNEICLNFKHIGERSSGRFSGSDIIVAKVFL